MSEIRWLGPYAPEDRHADSETVDHIIALRKQLEIAESQMHNALSASVAAMHRERIFRYALNDIQAVSKDDVVKQIVTTTFEKVNEI